MNDASRKSILSRLRQRTLEAVPPPGAVQGITYPDRQAAFEESLEAVGGTAIWLAPDQDLDEVLGSIPGYAEATQVASVVPGVNRANFDLAAIDDPHEIEVLDFFIGRGEFAVAENGAVWVTDAGVKYRVAYFINQHLVLLVPASAIVNNMHEAYDRLSLGERGFGAFISGPSKTADIEQSLVIGAHGARSLNVIMVS